LSESPLEKLLRLATANVRGYTRVVRGRAEAVRPHVETRTDAAGGGWIPEPKWQAGQQEWEKEGEAAWEKKGQAAWESHEWVRRAAEVKPGRDERSGSSRAPAQPGGVRPGADRRPHVSSARAQQRAERMAARSGRLQNRAAGGVQPVPSRPTGTLQERVEQMESARKTEADRVGNHPLFNQPPAVASPSEQLISEAANRAVQDAAVRSGVMDESTMSHVMGELAALEAQVTSAHQRIASETKEVEKRVEHHKREEARARMALNILGILAGILLIAVTGGVGAIVGEVMAFGWTVEVGRELATYHGIESGKHPKVREVLAHPVAAPSRAVSKTLGSAVTRKQAP
jgi:hypothetical protein